VHCNPVTAKIVGRTAETNRLALRVLDLSYLPKQTITLATPATPSSASTTAWKRSNRWDDRVESSTPSKRRKAGLGTKSIDESEDNSTIIVHATPEAVDNSVTNQ
jgi:hypothetical protein